MSARWTGRRPGRLADAGSEDVLSRAACSGALAEADASEASAAAVPICTQQAVGPRPAPPVYKDPQHERKRQYDRGSYCGG
eukprot:5355618-Amphidinium_carterae.1